MDISLQIVIDGNTKSLGGYKDAAKSRAGDVIDAIDTASFATLVGGEYRVNGGIGSVRLGFIHITGVPTTVSKVRQLIKGGLHKKQTVTDDVTGLQRNVDVATLRKHKWRINPADVPLAARNKLIAQREITITWTQAKNFLKRKTVVSELDATQDSTTLIVDSDVA